MLAVAVVIKSLAFQKSFLPALALRLLLFYKLNLPNINCQPTPQNTPQNTPQSFEKVKVVQHPLRTHLHIASYNNVISLKDGASLRNRL
jgi:hypothetical protein